MKSLIAFITVLSFFFSASHASAGNVNASSFGCIALKSGNGENQYLPVNVKNTNGNDKEFSVILGTKAVSISSTLSADISVSINVPWATNLTVYLREATNNHLISVNEVFVAKNGNYNLIIPVDSSGFSYGITCKATSE